MLIKSPIGLITFGAFLCLQVFPGQAEPFATQDQTPFSLIHGQPQPVAAALPSEGSLNWSTTLDITNTLNVQFLTEEDILIDFESYHLRLSMSYGISKHLAVRLDIPVIHYGGGFLDNTVDTWHDVFGLPQGNRPRVNNDQFSIIYTRNGVDVIDLDQGTTSLGDIQLAVARSLVQNTDTALSLWASIDLPTGELNELTGNDATDFSAWLAGQHKHGSNWSSDYNLGVLLPGKSQVSVLRVEDYVVFGHVGSQWSPDPLFDLRIQFGGHTSYYSNSSLRLLNEGYNIVFGGTLHVSQCSDVDIAVSEDIKVSASQDVSFLFSWRSKTNCSTN